MQFESLIEVSQHFAKPETCLEHLTLLRWKGHVKCTFCNHDKVYALQGRYKRYKCAKCRKQFSAIKGTIFENSPLPLSKWFMAIYLITSHKKGISSVQLGKDLGITQKSAWFVLHRIRFVLNSGTFEHSLGAMVEMDETFIGGKEENKHGYRQSRGKMIQGGERRVNNKMTVIGIVERGGNVKAQKAPDAKGKSLIPFIKSNLDTSVTLVTDEWMGYFNVAKEGYRHERVQHKTGGFVRGIFHTQNIEGFWSQLKRGILGIYHQVSHKHLDNYVGEFQYRYNTRKLTQQERFERMITLGAEQRLTYLELVSNG